MSIIVQNNQNKVSESHFVHFYRDDKFLSGALLEYIKAGVAKEEGIVIIATESQFADLCRTLPEKIISSIRFEDANWFFSLIYHDGNLYMEKFETQMNVILDEMRGYYKKIRLFAGLVDIFCIRNRPDIAIALEDYWNRFLERQEDLVVMCSYNLRFLNQTLYREILHSHSFSCGNGDELNCVDDYCRKISTLEMEKTEEKLQKNYNNEMKELKQRLLHSSKLSDLGEISACLSHELMNPLSIISNYSQIISMAISDDEFSSKEFLQTQLTGINANITRMSNLLKSILRYSHSGETVKEFLVENGIRDAVEMMRPMLKSKNIKLIYASPDVPVFMHGDEGQILQIIFNLICNARDAIIEAHQSRGGVIQIRMEAEQEKFMIHVEDNGSGIDGMIIENIWKPFFTTKPAGKGTGLGLPIVRKIIHNYGGIIDCKSRPEQGTVFTVVLPRLAS